MTLRKNLIQRSARSARLESRSALMRQAALLAASLLLVSAFASIALAGDRRETMLWEGRERSYLLHVPEGGGAALPLVIVLHGAGGNAAAFAEETQFTAAAEPRHDLVVFPDGIGNEPGKLSWNAHICCGAALAQKSDDLGFILALIDHISGELPVDAHRIYATGMSNGAMLSYQLAAAHPERFAAIAAVSGAIGGTSRDGERFVIPPPARPVPVMIIHGRKDPYILFDGGTSTLLGYPKRSNMAVADALALWSEADGCAPEPQRTEPTPGKLARTLFTECRGGAAVMLWDIEEGDHNWPPSDMLFPAPGGMTRSAAAEILAFFAEHRRE
jgi:polyhydroxybutyrate depolymerase